MNMYLSDAIPGYVRGVAVLTGVPPAAAKHPALLLLLY